jgi:hypothetical protein
VKHAEVKGNFVNVKKYFGKGESIVYLMHKAYKPVTLADRSKAWAVFARSDSSRSR